MDLNTISEEELAGQAVYTVQDSPCPLNTPNRAEKSLPKNLVLKPTNALPDSSIIGDHTVVPIGNTSCLMTA
jgi:hypothetical protein